MRSSRNALAMGPGIMVTACLLGVARCYDMYPCTEKPTYTNMSCPAGTAIACWSLEPNVPWLCWATALVPDWLFGPLPDTPGDVNCKSYPSAPGAARHFYDGACTFETPTKAPLTPLKPPPLSWDEAYKKADRTLVQMEASEKYKLMKGVGWYWPPGSGWMDLRKWWYVGNTEAIPRLGIPSLNMQDSAGGFRTYWEELVGTVTLWPSQLALTATWDEGVVRSFAMALGAEFGGKGANVVLGPSVNVHRCARGGRNFEYLSGEDPYLGSRLVKAWIDGVQSQGIMAVVKHWVFNEQETRRDDEDSQVDAKTAWELYYPPFQAAVDAGVSAAMCSYNRANGRHSCANADLLRILKKEMGFRGFVQSDWWALHSQSLAAGTDQDMPGISDKGIGITATCSPSKGCKNLTTWYDPKILDKQRPELVDTAARRILAATYRLNISNSCTPPKCKGRFMQNVTSPAHAALARYAAVESVVMLRNEGVLPLVTTGKNKVKKIAVLGQAAVAKCYDPEGLSQGHGVWNQGDYYSGGGSGHVVGASYQLVNVLTGMKNRAALAGVEVLAETTNKTEEAVKVAQQADVTFVVAGATSGEAADRGNLQLDGNIDSYIKEVAKASKKVVVIMLIPGAVLMPWRHEVAGILLIFLGGQATGDAIADIVFGDHAPAGRLPIMMPETEVDAIQPSTEDHVMYKEGLSTSYRNRDFKAAYPFGFGLTYTTFRYGSAVKVECPGGETSDICLKVSVQNVGKVAAKAVPQLYLQFPPEAEHPAPFLKGFQKTPVLLPGATQDVSFRLTDKDLRFYDSRLQKWIRPLWVTANLGESSDPDNFRQQLLLEVTRNPTGKTLWIVLGIIFALAVSLGVVLLVRNARRKCKIGERALGCGEDSEYTDSSSNDGDSDS